MDENKSEEEVCDPAVEDCDSLKKQMRGAVRESDVLEMSKRNFVLAKKALESNKQLFDTEDGEKTFDDQIADFDKKIGKVDELLKEQDDKLWDGMKKFNLCETTEEHPSVQVPPPEQEVSQPNTETKKHVSKPSEEPPA